MMSMKPQTIKVGCGQMRATFLNEAEKALDSIRQLIAQAARQHIDLLVLPECAYPAYLLGSVQSYRQANCLRGTEYLAELRNAARHHRMHIVSGFIDEIGDRLFNGAALISPQGQIIGTYHKSLLWHADARWFEPGQEVRALDTELGRIGILICADARIPELVATLAADGARLIALPTCWINTAKQPGEYYNPQSDFLIRARSLEFGVPFVCANKFGLETGNVRYNGQSLITAADGSVTAQADRQSQQILSADLKPGEPARIHTPDRWREIILSQTTQRAAKSEGHQCVTLAIMSAQALDALLDTADENADRSAGNFLDALRRAGVSLLITLAPEQNLAQRLSQWGAARDLPVLAYPHRVDVQHLAGVPIGTISGQSARTFESTRALALQGAGLIAVFGPNTPLNLLRARALENRVYVAAVDKSNARLFGVNGEPIPPMQLRLPSPLHETQNILKFEIEPARATDKCVATGTNIFQQRRPSLYRW